MDFDFNDEQTLLRDAVRRFVDKEYGFAARHAILAGGGFSLKAWRRLAGLGLLGVAVPERFGGTGAGPVESMIVMEELGRGLVLEPVAVVAVMAAGLLRDAGSVQQQAAWLPPLAAGEAILAVAHGEPAARYERRHVECRAAMEQQGVVLSGSKAVVLAGGLADAFIVSARSSGAVAAPEGVSLFLVPREAAGLVVRSYRTHDGATAAELALHDVKLGPEACIGTPGQGLAAIEQALDQGIAALCAEAVGAMQRLFEMTAEYLQTRKQFGQPLASFQALRHRLVDMRVQLELARSMSYYASLKLSEAHAPGAAASAALAVSAAKVQVGQAARFVGQQAIQLHGGIGMTDEYAAGHYFKRLTMIELSLGDTAYHLGRYAQGLQLEEAAG
jgi:alkylation response protein AidB-like acyl-CoA dehydrogenase